MVVFIEPDDELLEPIDIETRPAWIEAAVSRLHPLISQATFETRKDDRGREVPVPPAQDILRRAVAAQITAWRRWEIDPTAPATRTKSSVTLGPATVSYDYRDNHAAEYGRVRDGIDPTAASLIRTIIQQPAY